MYRLSTIAFTGMLALTMASCGSGGEENSAVTPSAPQAVPAKAFDKPPMVAQLTDAVASVPGLIQPTNAAQRTKQVQKGRQDPFAVLFVQAVETVPSTERNRGRLIPRIPSRPSPSRTKAQSSRTVALGTSPNPGRLPNPIGQGNSLPPVVPGSVSTLPPPPALPQPDLAKTVAVTGVVQIGSDPQAIVKVPNEATSRYVRVGQLLANGQVLVKRIEISEGADPTVILEQYGVEVSRAVGEETVNSGQAASLPTPAPQVPSPPPINQSPSGV